jgi:hypothetical protein
MKNLLIILSMHFLSASLLYAQDCTTQTKDVVYAVNSQLPKHLQGATIIVRTKDGRESSVPAERFMVVPRKQYTKVGQSSDTMCKAKSRKNSVMVGVRNDHAGMDAITKTTPTSVSAKVESKKALTPDLQYYRREILDSHLGLGAGVDANGTLRGIIGLDF